MDILVKREVAKQMYNFDIVNYTRNEINIFKRFYIII